MIERLEYDYNLKLRQFLSKNENVTEYNFLKIEIENLTQSIPELEAKIKKLESEIPSQDYTEAAAHLFPNNYHQIKLELKRAKDSIDEARMKLRDCEIKINRLPQHHLGSSQKQNNGPLVSGKKLNIVDRYHIAKEVLDIDGIINSKNISLTEKHNLLAHIMGCNQQTARELWNNTQQKRTKLNEENINTYLEKLK
ncbi:hypothetical protein [Sediminicola arcticus]|uniref:Uncharacterized protein n=1 Tax=Sediminicola arcticus TaxID=1574308 RepID=A0ABV2SXI2_9FLAO